MATTNLDIAEVAPAQNNKEITINDAIEALDQATQGALAVAVSGDTTLTAVQYRSRFMFELSGSPSSGFSLTLPDDIERLIAVRNTTDQLCTLTLDTSTLAIPAGTQAVVWSDGETLRPLSGAAGALGYRPVVRELTGDTTLTLADEGAYLAVDSASAVTLTLPAAGPGDVGYRVLVKRTGAGSVTLDGDGSDTVEGAATYAIPATGDIITLMLTSETTWEVVARS